MPFQAKSEKRKAIGEKCHKGEKTKPNHIINISTSDAWMIK